MVLLTDAPLESDAGAHTPRGDTAPLGVAATENFASDPATNLHASTLVAFANLGERLAGATVRGQLYRTATQGVRTLLGCDRVAPFVGERPNNEAGLVMADPPRASVNMDLLKMTVPICAGSEQLGTLVASGSRQFRADEDALLRAVASQVAVALKRTELLERLTRENLPTQVFDALSSCDVQLAKNHAREVGVDLDGRYMVVAAGPLPTDKRSWIDVCSDLAERLRRELPGTICDASNQRFRSLVPLPEGSAAGCRLHVLPAIAKQFGVSIGSSEPTVGPASGAAASRQAADAQRIAAALLPDGGALPCEHLGAYKFLVHISPNDKPADRLLVALERIEDYDSRRHSALLETLETYLHHGRSFTATARVLLLHPNTVRQRLARIDRIGAIEVVNEDALELELAVKLRKLRGSGPRPRSDTSW